MTSARNLHVAALTGLLLGSPASVFVGPSERGSKADRAGNDIVWGSVAAGGTLGGSS